jgi:hypothetical protein
MINRKNITLEKKKNHTLKNQIIMTEKGTEIVDVIVGKRDPESDVNLLIKQQKNFDKEQKFQGDKGYQGVEKTITPQKQPRKQEMPPEIKEDNLKLAKKRIFAVKPNIFNSVWF